MALDADIDTAREVTAESRPCTAHDAGSLEEVARAVEEYSRRDGFERRCEIGETVLRELFGGSRLAFRAQGSTRATSFRKLAALLAGRVSKSELHRAVTVHLLCVDLRFVPTSGHLTVSHADAVEGLPRAQQERLLRRAESEVWTVRRLRDEKREIVERSTFAEGKRRPGRPRASSVQVAEALARRAAKRLEALVELFDEEAGDSGKTLASPELVTCLERIREDCAALQRRIAGHAGSSSTRPRAAVA